MDLTLFEHFLVIAEKLSFTKAAEELDKSESVLSRQMVRLESELGLELFERSTRKVSLTPAGEILKDSVKNSFDAFYEVLEKCRNANAGNTGIVKIATLPNYYIPDYTFSLLKDFKNQSNSIDIEIVSANLAEFPSLLYNGQVDFVYSVIDDYADNPLIDSVFIELTHTFLLVSRDSPVLNSGKTSFSLADFKDYDILVGTENPKKNARIIEICESVGFTPSFRNVFDEAQFLMCIREGAGIGITDDTHMLSGNQSIMHLYVPELNSCRLGFSYIPQKTSGYKKIFLDYMYNTKNPTNQ